MKKIIVLLALVGCSRHNNAASEIKWNIEKNAQCKSLYTNAGSNHVDMAICTLQDKKVELCMVDVTMSFNCRTIKEAPPPSAAVGSGSAH